MKITKMLKLALSALLLAAGTTAFAAGEGETTTGPVKLGDGKTSVTWAEFVAAINNPSSIKGVVPADDPVRKALADSLNKVTTDSTNLVNVKAANNTANLTDTLQAKLDAREAFIAGLKKTYDNLNDTLAAKQGILEAYQEQQQDTTTQLTNDRSKKGDITTDIRNVNDSIDKCGTNSMTYATVGWLATLVRDAGAFDTQYTQYNTLVGNYLDAEEENGNSDANYKDAPYNPADYPNKIWYKLTKGKQGTKTIYSVTISYNDTALTDSLESGWSGPVNAPEFFAFVIDDLQESKGLETVKLYVYYGSDYATATESKTTTLLAAQSADIYGLPELALSNLQTTSRDNTFKVSTTTLVYPKEGEAGYADYKALLDRRDALNSALEAIVKVIARRESFLTTVGTKISTIRGEINTLKNTEIPAAKTAYDNAVAGVTVDSEGNTVTDKYKQAVDEAQDALDNAEANIKAAEDKLANSRAGVETARQALAAAQATADAEARESYQEITLTEDINATDAEGITANYTGNIDGEGHIITISGTEPLFRNYFYGHLSNAAINGAFAKNITGTGGAAVFTNVVRWNNGSGVIYAEDGKSSNYTDLGKLGFDIRDNKDFGVDLSAKLLAPKSNATKVYSLTTYGTGLTGDPKTVQNYVNVTADKTLMGVNGAVTIPANRFAQSATDDVAGLGLTNVFYVDGSANICENVEIKDCVVGSNPDAEKSFYAPVEIEATNITYTRTFSQGINTTCLPFALAENIPGIESICSYTTESSEKFWFTKNAGSIAANTPILFKTNSDLTQISVQNTTIPQTSGDQYVIKNATDENSKSKVAGTLKTVFANQIFGENNNGFVYGYNKTSGQFQLAGSATKFPAFRLLILSEYAVNGRSTLGSEGAPAERGIGILDEDGNDITDELFGEGGNSGVESAVEDALSIVGGQGEISITAQADYGKVAIYTIDGRVVAQPTVAAGTTTVNVSKGLYIVLGKKVIVD